MRCTASQTPALPGETKCATAECPRAGVLRFKRQGEPLCRNCYTVATREARRDAKTCVQCQAPITHKTLCPACLSQFQCRAAGLRGSNAKSMRARFNVDSSCALTGWPLEYGNTASIDHIVPKSRGGDNTLRNLRWVDKRVNYAKRDLTDHEFIALCRAVVAHADRVKLQRVA
jgi:5-methylcytosine-specific restriction endonuclease McrA